MSPSGCLVDRGVGGEIGWLLAIHLMATSKKGVSAHQLYRNLGFGSYRTAWFLARRVRAAITELEPNKSGDPLGGKDKVVEANETVVGAKSKNRAYRDPAPKKMVATLVERGGRVRSKHVAAINAKTLPPFVVKNVSRKSTPNSASKTKSAPHLLSRASKPSD